MEGQCTLIHNHDLIDAVTLPRDHPIYRTLRKEQRVKAFAQHVLAPETKEKCVVFTGMRAISGIVWHIRETYRSADSQCANERDASVAEEYRDAAAAAGRPFVPVYLRLSRGENVRRIASTSRVTSGTGKLVDPSILMSIRDGCDLFEFSDVEGLRLDVTEIDAEESARRIFRHVRRFCQERY